MRGSMKSRPTRARGLKLDLCVENHLPDKSRPTRARGLKPSAGTRNCPAHRVAPHAGAWIET